MTEFPKCRFLETVQKMPPEEICPEDLRTQYEEFISIVQAYLCGQTYFEVYDTFDSLVHLLELSLDGKKNARP